MFFDCNDDYWAIGFDCSSGDKYCIADMNDCEDMTLAEIKRDLKDRIEVYKQIKWS
jgi:erythromycin esterase-like protein